VGQELPRLKKLAKMNTIKVPAKLKTAAKKFLKKNGEKKETLCDGGVIIKYLTEFHLQESEPLVRSIEQLINDLERVPIGAMARSGVEHLTRILPNYKPK
jgi:hypothetical protein